MDSPIVVRHRSGRMFSEYGREFMRQAGMSLTFLSNIVFPMIYQVIFSYFLLISVGMQTMRSLVIVGTSIVGIPLIAFTNQQRLDQAKQEGNTQPSVRPLVSAMLLPLTQITLLSVFG